MFASQFLLPAVSVLALLASACGNDSQSANPTPQAPRIAGVRELGTVAMPPNVIGRDGGFSGIVNGRLLWTFGDTFYNPSAADGSGFRSNTAALADLSNPLAATEPLDSAGAPWPFLAFTPQEQRYNDSTGKPDERYALWTGSIIPDGERGALVFYEKLKVHAGTLNYEAIGCGIARMSRDTTFAVRDTALLFTTPEPMLTLATVAGDTVYMYGGKNDGTPYAPVVIARVARSQIDRRSAYRFWDGGGWVEDYRRAAVILGFIPGDVSISWNPWLKSWLAVHSGFFANTIQMRTAPSPQGPWSDPVTMFTGADPAAGSNDYAGKEQPHLAAEGGRRISVTYHQPTGFLSGRIHLVEVVFN
ncbi:MAG TPA: DUF4185 domain-containing protein [Candidatus Kapabacteria bacterium]|nr:DUF4185 domain-containing protein [Candidatus Kapabacteria bacterium]